MIGAQGSSSLKIFESYQMKAEHFLKVVTVDSCNEGMLVYGLSVGKFATRMLLTAYVLCRQTSQ